MAVRELLAGTVHELPSDLRTAIIENGAADHWDDLTPLGRNEWICWVTSAKQDATRAKRISRAYAEVAGGKRRPCCWPGCPHRERNGADPSTGCRERLHVNRCTPTLIR